MCCMMLILSVYCLFYWSFSKSSQCYFWILCIGLCSTALLLVFSLSGVCNCNFYICWCLLLCYFVSMIFCIRSWTFWCFSTVPLRPMVLYKLLMYQLIFLLQAKSDWSGMWGSHGITMFCNVWYQTLLQFVLLSFSFRDMMFLCLISLLIVTVFFDLIAFISFSTLTQDRWSLRLSTTTWLIWFSQCLWLIRMISINVALSLAIWVGLVIVGTSPFSRMVSMKSCIPVCLILENLDYGLIWLPSPSFPFLVLFVIFINFSINVLAFELGGSVYTPWDQDFSVCSYFCKTAI